MFACSMNIWTIKTLSTHETLTKSHSSKHQYPRGRDWLVSFLAILYFALCFLVVYLFFILCGSILCCSVIPSCSFSSAKIFVFSLSILVSGAPVIWPLPDPWGVGGRTTINHWRGIHHGKTYRSPGLAFFSWHGLRRQPDEILQLVMLIIKNGRSYLGTQESYTIPTVKGEQLLLIVGSLVGHGIWNRYDALIETRMKIVQADQSDRSADDDEKTQYLKQSQHSNKCLVAWTMKRERTCSRRGSHLLPGPRDLVRWH